VKELNAKLEELKKSFDAIADQVMAIPQSKKLDGEFFEVTCNDAKLLFYTSKNYTNDEFGAVVQKALSDAMDSIGYAGVETFIEHMLKVEGMFHVVTNLSPTCHISIKDDDGIAMLVKEG